MNYSQACFMRWYLEVKNQEYPTKNEQREFSNAVL